MRIKRSFLLSFLSILLISLSGCAFWVDEASDESTQMDMMVELEESSDAATNDTELDLGEKIIENASLSFETIHFKETTDFINNQLDSYDASIESSSRGQSSSSYGFLGEYISMTIRLPNNLLHPFINELNDYDDLYLQSEEISRVDVTKEFRDNETRLAVLKEEEVALREMLQEQGSLEEVLQIRTRLSEVIAEREIYENENKYYENQSEFSTIYLYLQQADRANVRDLSGFGSRFKNAFIDSFYRFIAVSQSLLIGSVYLIPYLIILLLITIIFYFVLRTLRKNK